MDFEERFTNACTNKSIDIFADLYAEDPEKLLDYYMDYYFIHTIDSCTHTHIQFHYSSESDVDNAPIREVNNVVLPIIMEYPLRLIYGDNLRKRYWIRQTRAKNAYQYFWDIFGYLPEIYEHDIRLFLRRHAKIDHLLQWLCDAATRNIKIYKHIAQFLHDHIDGNDAERYRMVAKEIIESYCGNYEIIETMVLRSPIRLEDLISIACIQAIVIFLREKAMNRRGAAMMIKHRSKLIYNKIKFVLEED